MVNFKTFRINNKAILKIAILIFSNLLTYILTYNIAISTIDNIREENSKLVNENRELRNKLNSIEGDKQKIENKYNTQINELKYENEGLKKDINFYKNLIQDLKNDIEDLKNQLDKTYSNYTNTNTEEKQANISSSIGDKLKIKLFGTPRIKISTIPSQKYNELDDILELYCLNDSYIIDKQKVKYIHLRSEPKSLSEYDVMTIIKKLNFYDYSRNRDGRGLNNKFELDKIKGDNVVLDKTTNLMWQQCTSQMPIKSVEVCEWINKINREGYASYHDWRLPTLEEAMSLMESEKRNGDLYIDPIFNKIEDWIWTSDLVDGYQYPWAVCFFNGDCYRYGFDDNNVSYILAVRSVESPKILWSNINIKKLN
ncbi:MAG: DUF1566 domain-containing protein [Candidatus Hodarchaeota archaeon]